MEKRHFAQLLLITSRTEKSKRLEIISVAYRIIVSPTDKGVMSLLPDKISPDGDWANVFLYFYT